MERILNSPPDLCSKIRRPKISTPYLLCFLGERSTKIPGTSPSGCLPRLRPRLAQFRSLTVQCKSLPDRGHMCIESTDSALPSRWTRPVIHIYFSASVRQAGRSAQVAPYKYADTPTVTDATDSAILSIVASYVDDCTASFAEPTVHSICMVRKESYEPCSRNTTYWDHQLLLPGTSRYRRRLRNRLVFHLSPSA